MGGRASAHRADSRTTSGENRRRVVAQRSRPTGRPSRAQALLLRDRILEVATELFLTEGYGATSIEAVAERAGISKRTFYHRFENKAVLFAAVVHRIIEQIRPPPGVALLEGATLYQILRRLARLILRAALAPQAIALHRLITAESLRFPNLARAVYDESREATALIGNLLARGLSGVRLKGELRDLAARQFIYLVVTLPQRRTMGFGPRMTAKELESWADHAVRLFLNGCRGLSSRMR